MFPAALERTTGTAWIVFLGMGEGWRYKAAARNIGLRESITTDPRNPVLRLATSNNNSNAGEAQRVVTRVATRLAASTSVRGVIESTKYSRSLPSDSGTRRSNLSL